MNQTFILLLIVLFFAGCGGSSKSITEKNNITGTWTITTAYQQRSDLENKYPTESQRVADSLLKKRYTGMVYTFSEDGKLSILFDGQKLEGTWSFIKDDKTNKELTAIEMKGGDWSETWLPAVGESLFYMKGIDSAIEAKVLGAAEDGGVVVLGLSKKE